MISSSDQLINKMNYDYIRNRINSRNRINKLSNKNYNVVQAIRRYYTSLEIRKEKNKFKGTNLEKYIGKPCNNNTTCSEISSYLYCRKKLHREPFCAPRIN